MEDTVTIPTVLFNRMAKALVRVEEILAKQPTNDWLTEEEALMLLNCKRTKLFELVKMGNVRYKRVGRINTYNRKSILRYNEQMSS